MATTTVPSLWETVPGNRPGTVEIKFNFSPGQSRAWVSQKRFVTVIAGTQGGKTSFGPPWLFNEIQLRGPGDYMIVTPTYQILQKKCLPEFMRLFKRQFKLGDYNTQTKIFTFTEAASKRLFGDRFDPDTPTQIFFCYATEPESLESATAKAAWLDEAGQKKFRLGSWEAIQRRLAMHKGRVLITTTPYDLGWLKQKLWDPWIESKGNHPLIDVIRFDSTENPAFPLEEFERARHDLPRWKFDLFYRAIFTRPAGLIYSSFDLSRHKIPRFEIPESWPRFLGIDFGGVNTAGVFFAEERRDDGKPTGRLIAYREYKGGDKTASEHTHDLMVPEPRIPTCAGGSKSEGQWRKEFAQGGTVKGKRIPGLPIHGPGKPENEAMVEVGINRVFKEFANDRILVMDDLSGLLDELASYSRELDDAGNATEKIDSKSSYHFLDAVRYIVGYLNRDKPRATGYNGSVASPGLQNL